jgi:hypothetical protein
MIARASMQNGNPNPGTVPFEIVLTLTTYRGCSRYAVQVPTALGIDCRWVDESTGPEYVNLKSCMCQYEKIAASSLSLQAKNLDFGIAAHL